MLFEVDHANFKNDGRSNLCFMNELKDRIDLLVKIIKTLMAQIDGRRRGTRPQKQFEVSYRQAEASLRYAEASLRQAEASQRLT